MHHPERIAAGMADLNDMVFRYHPPVTTARWPLGKLARHFIGLALLLGAVVWGW